MFDEAAFEAGITSLRSRWDDLPRSRRDRYLQNLDAELVEAERVATTDHERMAISRMVDELDRLRVDAYGESWRLDELLSKKPEPEDHDIGKI